jgi:protein-S-isoprenylcysteine O-methyltransferase Ste14
MSYRIATFALGLVIGGYWLRVLRMARKARRRTGRAANLIPREPVGRLLRLLWTPVVLLWVGQPFVSALVHSPPAPLRPIWANAWIAWACVLVAGAAFWLTRVCWRTMGRNWRMGIDPSERTSLVVEGPFQYVRHPIYALSQVMMLAAVAAVPSPLMLAAGALHLLLLQWEARREEAHMHRTHGDAYLSYCSRVGRFLPFKSIASRA